MNSDTSERDDKRVERIRALISSAKSQTAIANRSALSDSRSHIAADSSGSAPDSGIDGSLGVVTARFPGFDLLREIHRGGQGVVYEAFQRSTHRRVAIKVMREGPFAGASDRARFEREVQVLAGLSHPNIVSIHDSGRVAGHDYFVMDMIDGKPLDRFVIGSRKHVSSRNAPLPDIPFVIRLFIKVCSGVNAAHLRGVIHRDLKAGNILVDAQGEPHILDFGLAKESDPVVGGTPATMTVTDHFVGSLPWASPEQTRGATVDLRTDVYSLGVMLFQCLTNRFPYEVVGPGADVIERIRDLEPQRPRGVRPDIGTDLETIILKCLAKDRERRYQSAGELGRDLDRYLRGEAIEARGDSTLYVIRKAIRRHRLASAAAAGFVLLIAMFGLAMAAQASKTAQERDRAETQRRRAQRVQAFMQSMLASVVPDGVPPSEVTVRSILDGGAARVDVEFADWPEDAASVHQTLAESYDRLGYFEEAEPHAKRAWQLRREIHGDSHPLTFQSHARLALIVFNKQDLSAAEPLLREAIAVGERALGADSLEVIRLSNDLNALLVQQRRFEGTEASLRQTIETTPKKLGPDHWTVATAHRVLARSLHGLGRNEEALAELQLAAGIIRRTNGEESFAFEDVCAIEAQIYEALGEIGQAKTLLQQVVNSRRHRMGDEHPALAWNLLCLGRLLFEHDHDATGAEPLVRQALSIQLSRKGPDHADTADCQLLLGKILMTKSAFEEAEPRLRENLRIRLLHPLVPEDLNVARMLLAECLAARGDSEAATEIRRNNEGRD